MNELPDLTTYSREQLLELVGILHNGLVQASANFDDAMRLLRGITGRPSDTSGETKEGSNG
jgi:hypothetical protein